LCGAVHRRSAGGGWSQRCCEHAGAVSSTQLCRYIVRLWSLQSCILVQLLHESHTSNTRIITSALNARVYLHS
jgi:hypothetical protein